MNSDAFMNGLSVEQRPVRLVIASEDKYACQEYLVLFRELIQGWERVVFVAEFLQPRGSAPKVLLEEMMIRVGQEYKNVNKEEFPPTQYWLVFDRDIWDIKQLQDLYQQLKEQQSKGVPLYAAMSNPCFAHWLYLHFSPPPDKPLTCKQVEKEVQALGGLNKDDSKKLNRCFKAYLGEGQGRECLQKISKAIEYAKNEVSEQLTLLEFLEKSSGTHFYQLVEPLLLAAHTKLDWLRG